MDYLRGYRTFRSDPEWSSKMFVGVALALSALFIPILGSVAMAGWAVMVLRRSVHGIETPLPRLDFDFDYLGKLLSPGFKAFIVRLLWTLPASMAFVTFGMCAYVGVIVGIGTGVSAAGDVGGFAALACGLVVMLLMYPLLILTMMPATIAAMRTELTDDINEGLKFGEVFSMTKLLLKELFVGSLLIGTIQICLTMLGVMLCYFPAFFAMWLGIYVHAIFQADLYRAYLAKGGAPLPKLAPPELPVTPRPQYPQYPQPPQQLPPQQQGGW